MGIQLRPNLLVLVFLLTFSTVAMAQEKVNPIDSTISRPDTSIILDSKINAEDNIPIVSIDEDDAKDGSAINISSQLNAGRDPFLSGATFHFSDVYFHMRGYDADLFSTYMNGAPMENLDNGSTPYALWGGLNNVTRNKQTITGLRANSFAFGDFGGTTLIDTRASKQRRQTVVDYSYSNGVYTHKFDFTHSTGLTKDGWAFTFSGSRRWSGEGYVPGTYYDGWSVFAGLDKKINARHLLSLVAFVTPTENARQGSTTQEMYDIAGSHYYNNDWGYQNGKVRSVNVSKTTQPVFILTHDWKVSPKTSVLTAASYSFGKRKVSSLDWYNAPDPRPDYFHYLPSDQDSARLQDSVLKAMRSDVNLRQINWSKLYNINYNSQDPIYNANGIAGNTLIGRAHYIIQDRVTSTQKFNFNTTLNAAIASNIDFTAGASYQMQKNNYYQQVEDLLGAKFYVDVNQFAQRDYPINENSYQNDVNHPNRILHVGDKFGYNYDINFQQAKAWAQAIFKLKKFDIFGGIEHTYTNFYRYGYTKNGLFPDNSFGKSTAFQFYNYAFKAGITYKVDGRNFVYLNGEYATKPPSYQNVYLSPETRDIAQDNVTSEIVKSVEAGYIYTGPTLKVHASGYFTDFKDGLDIKRFYSDEYSSFANIGLRNIGEQHFGTELGVDAKLYKGLSLNAAASISRFYYTTRQLMTLTVDNTDSLLANNDTVYSKNFRVATPQEAYTLGLQYRSPHYWSISANVNYFDQMWQDFSPVRRTYSAVKGLDPTSSQWHSIIDQTKLPSAYTVDLYANCSFILNKWIKSIKKRTYLDFSLDVNNVLDNNNIVSRSYEQLRYDFKTHAAGTYPPRLTYAYGRTFTLSAKVRF